MCWYCAQIPKACPTSCSKRLPTADQWSPRELEAYLKSSPTVRTGSSYRPVNVRRWSRRCVHCWATPIWRLVSDDKAAKPSKNASTFVAAPRPSKRCISPFLTSADRNEVPSPMQSTAESPITGAAWITWEHQRRNIGVSSGLGVPLFELAFKGGRLKRYVKSLLATARVLTTKKPAVLFVQNPSIVLALTAVVWGRLRGRPVIVDAHNAGLTPFEGRSGLLTRAAAFVSRHASLTIVSNAALTPIVDAYGGRPFVLP